MVIRVAPGSAFSSSFSFPSPSLSNFLMISSRDGRPSLEPGFLTSFSGFAYMPIDNPMAERKMSIFFIFNFKG